MTDTTKTPAQRLARVLRILAVLAEREAFGMAEQHEARWAAERAKLVEELEAFRALAKKAHDMNQRSAIGVYEVTGVFHELAALAPKENATPYDADSTQVS